ncbi:MAG TPA: hypothetical protein EYP19_11460 [Desulfobacterales bacterium]|nr:hypothetical protein [Desulfobacterales bacterium]
MKKVSVVFWLSLLLFPVSAEAIDYKAWIPLLPGTLGGNPRSGDPEGMNMEMGANKWASLNQEYASGDGEKSVELSIMAGMGAPQVQGYQAMAGMNMQMETGDEIVKTVTVSGRKAMLTLDKKDKTGTLVIYLENYAVVVLQADPATEEAHLTQLAQELPLDKFAAAAK